ncbi:hypothetical protein PsorP6_015412 [Peronosclerospora sorghi]|uniref:Uncharacterized protein n=1 Tax=Peronosclerospora sorghi TaxID=230839 RepID=A0ACC0WM69_9STRA|nr:hypothetical protein PsorP6_015412 [Peronosclerospora sorghi]
MLYPGLVDQPHWETSMVISEDLTRGIAMTSCLKNQSHVSPHSPDTNAYASGTVFLLPYKLVASKSVPLYCVFFYECAV